MNDRAVEARTVMKAPSHGGFKVFPGLLRVERSGSGVRGRTRRIRSRRRGITQHGRTTSPSGAMHPAGNGNKCVASDTIFALDTPIPDSHNLTTFLGVQSYDHVIS